MKLISWNVNGLRACMQKGAEFFTASDADIFCIQESKLQEGQIDFAPEGYYAYWNYAQKKGYSGTAIFTRKEPLSVHYGIGIPQHDTEGRVITLEFPDFYMVTCYTPNSQNELARLSYRMEFFYPPVSPIRSAIFIRIPRASTPGGPTAFTPERRMPDGVSTTSSPHLHSMTVLWMQEFSPMSPAPITVR